MEALLAVALGAALGLGLFSGSLTLIFRHTRNSEERHFKRTLRTMPTSTISQLRDGEQAKIIGKVAYVDEPIVAPLSGRPCAYYRVIIEVGTSPYGTKIDDRNACASMWIDDGSDRALVDLQAPSVVAQVDPGFSGTLPTSWLRNAGPARYREAMRRPSAQQESSECHERRIQAGDEVVVSGVCKMEPDPDPGPERTREHGFRESPMRPRIVAPPGGELLISNDPSIVGMAQ